MCFKWKVSCSRVPYQIRLAAQCRVNGSLRLPHLLFSIWPDPPISFFCINLYQLYQQQQSLNKLQRKRKSDLSAGCFISFLVYGLSVPDILKTKSLKATWNLLKIRHVYLSLCSLLFQNKSLWRSNDYCRLYQISWKSLQLLFLCFV